MDKSTAASNAVRLINLANDNLDLRPSMIKAVCSYFDLMKDEVLSQADRLLCIIWPIKLDCHNIIIQC